ncbi:hypothetical protein LTR09_009410 [Extremus antarcticus]|uniref:Uncharacterized protein n=1 Tax=Extremus antarcticus TaxID=702011 RepID=A0AAJ0D8Z3_9PEZI|nr:hypothetical protein LTR09_009410 [Extremus antarcticus]
MVHGLPQSQPRAEVSFTLGTKEIALLYSTGQSLQHPDLTSEPNRPHQALDKSPPPTSNPKHNPNMHPSPHPLHLALAALTTFTLTHAQSDCSGWIPDGEIALGTSYQCGIGGPTISGSASPDCGVQTADIFSGAAETLSYSLEGDLCSGDYTNYWVVGCYSNGEVTLVVHEDTECWTCYEAEGACQVSFGGLSGGIIGRVLIVGLGRRGEGRVVGRLTSGGGLE